MRVRRALLVAIAVWAVRLAAAAQTADAPAPAPDDHGPWQLSLFGGGWNSIGTAYLYRTPGGTEEVAFGNAAAFGASVGLDATRFLGLELSWLQTNPPQQIVGSPPTVFRHVTLNVFELDSLWYFRRGGFEPYAIFGFGGASTGSSFGGTNFTAIVGLGVKAYLSRHFAARADVRANAMYGNVSPAGSAAFCDPAGCYYYRSSWYWALPVTAGLTYAF